MRNYLIALYVFAAAAAAWSVSIAGHELIGHGGICFINPDCRWVYVDAMYFSGSQNVGPWKVAELAAGSVFNISLGLFVWSILSLIGHRISPFVYILLHLILPVSFIHSGAYIAFGPMIHDGMDWAQLSNLAPNPDTARNWMLFSGLTLIAFGILLARRTSPLVKILPHFHRYILIAYLGYGVTALSASALVPSEDRVFMLTGGLGSGFLFMSFFILALIPSGKRANFAIELHNNRLFFLTLLINIVIALVYIFGLGPGIHFGTD